MAQYSYIGLDAHGKQIKDQIQAENEKAAVRQLREQSIYVLHIREGEDFGGISPTRKIIRAIHPSRLMPVTSGDLIVLFRQLALMLRAGHTLVTTLDLASDMQTKIGLIRSCRNMSDAIRRGASFSSSMAEHGRYFSPMVVNLIAAGERSGNLDAIIHRLADNLERNKDLKRQLLTAMFYPVVVLVSSLCVAVAMVVWVIPRFAAFLTARRASLPASTQFLLDVGGWALDWGWTIGTILGVAAFLTLVAYTTQRGKKVLHRVLLALPVLGKVSQYGAMAQTGWSLSLLLRSGMPAIQSLRISGEASPNYAVKASLLKAADGLLEGRALSKTLDQPHLPQMVRHMAAVGEKSGQIETVMDEMGQYYQKELAAKVKFMTVMIEPVMILIVGGMVGYVYFSIFQAVMSVSKGGM
ncbi:MAG TPA: type II secretion system F family protein [Phycisphaerales bacterium]|nr:type II secretion system F family protein [Phycisphaerales bacterium]HCD31266.1 type II secretion system F family protein [Phycisphaerales bacterium]|tara:strand:- start:11672 stop:12904 length:1233 start_codon:yes stop_codon:yes gene_type:complete